MTNEITRVLAALLCGESRFSCGFSRVGDRGHIIRCPRGIGDGKPAFAFDGWSED